MVGIYARISAAMLQIVPLYMKSSTFWFKQTNTSNEHNTMNSVSSSSSASSFSSDGNTATTRNEGQSPSSHLRIFSAMPAEEDPDNSGSGVKGEDDSMQIFQTYELVDESHAETETRTNQIVQELLDFVPNWQDYADKLRDVVVPVSARLAVERLLQSCHTYFPLRTHMRHDRDSINTEAEVLGAGAVGQVYASKRVID